MKLYESAMEHCAPPEELEARLREVLAEGGVEPAGFHHLTV